MTVLIPCSRTLSGLKVLPRSHHILARLISTNSNLRVSQPQTDRRPSAEPQCQSVAISTRFQQLRTYADAKAPAGRPKAHTGRAPARRTAVKKAAADATKARPRPAPKANTTVARAKATKAKAKAKPKAKPKVKVKAKPKTKKEPSARTLKERETRERSALRKQALLNSPKALPDNAWTVCFVENGPKKGQSLDLTGSSTRAAAQVYRNVTAEERERLNHIAHQNKATNEAAYKRWVQSFTPLQIKQANNARNLLALDAKKNGKKQKNFPHIKDDRLVKQPHNTFALFLKDRYASGDMQGMAIAEAAKLIGREWKDTTSAEKKTYEERVKVDHNRYLVEHKTVYGFDPPSVTNGASIAATV